MLDQLRFRFWRLRDRLVDLFAGRRHREAVFTRIYRDNLWGDAESVSGTGSGRSATERVRAALPGILQQYAVRTLLDAPCGDFQWMREIAGSVERYVGVDIVPVLIEKNRKAYGSPQVTFMCADISSEPLPPADLALCRDCFIHLPTRMIMAALQNMTQSGTRYILVTHNPGAPAYHDIPVGSFRPIDFTRAPFSFPAPLATIDETETGDRQLALWDLSDAAVRGRIGAGQRNT